MAKAAPEPQGAGFTPIEFTPPVVTDFVPIEVTSHSTPEVAPAAAADKPTSGEKEN